MDDVDLERLSVTNFPIDDVNLERLSVTSFPMDDVNLERLSITRFPMDDVNLERLSVTSFPMDDVNLERLSVTMFIGRKKETAQNRISNAEDTLISPTSKHEPLKWILARKHRKRRPPLATKAPLAFKTELIISRVTGSAD